VAPRLSVSFSEKEKMKFYTTAVAFVFGFVTTWASATAPDGSDNQGGVSAPAGTYFPSPNVSAVGLNPYTGNVTRVVNDLSVTSASGVGLNWTRYYSTRPSLGLSDFGTGGNWRHSFQWDFSLTTLNGSPAIEIVYPNGTTNYFTETSSNVWTSTNAVTDIIYQSGSAYQLKTSSNISYNFTNITVTQPGTEAQASGYEMTSIVDSKGLSTVLTYQVSFGSVPSGTGSIAAGGDLILKQVTEPGGRYIKVSIPNPPVPRFSPSVPTSGDYCVITEVTTSDGRTASYSYETFDLTSSSPTRLAYCLANVSYSGVVSAAYYNTQLTEYGTPVLSQAVDSRAQGISNIAYTYFTGTGAPFGAVQTISEGSTNTLICTLSLQNGNAQTPEVTFPDGSFYVYTVNAGGLLASIANSLNQTKSFSYTTSSGNLTTTLVDPNGNSSSFTRTSNGELLSKSIPPVGSEASSPTLYWYYNSAGYLTSSVDAKGYTTTYTRNATISQRSNA
jgi:hypothetical protein